MGSGQWHQWETLCLPLDCPTSVGSEEWGVGTVGSGSSGKPGRDQRAVGSRSGISGEWKARVGSRIRSEWNQGWGVGV